MNILFDARFVEEQNTGVGNCTLALMQRLPLVRPEHHCYFLRSGIHFTSHPWSDLWLHGYVPYLIRRRRADIYFSPAFYLPRFSGGAKLVSMVHDLAVYRHPESFPLKFTWYFREIIRQAVTSAHHIVVNSEFTREELLDAFRQLSAEQVTVIPLGPAPWLERFADAPELPLPPEIGPGPYFLHVGSLEPRKNLIRLIRAFLRWSEAHPEWKLVLAGKGGGYGQELEQIFQGNSQRLVFLGYVKDEQLPGLYRHARGLVVPSMYEGFGLPVLEAISTDLPIALSDIPSFQEIDGGESVSFDPLREETIEVALEELRKRAEAGTWVHPRKAEIVRHYSWDHAAEVLMTAFERLL